MTNFPWHESPPNESRHYKFSIYLISVVFLFAVSISFYAVMTENPKVLLWTVTYIFPLVFFSLICYFELKKSSERRRAGKLSETIERAEYLLERGKPDIYQFDQILSTELDEIRTGPASLYLYTTMIFLDLTKTIIVKEYDNIINENKKLIQKRSENLIKLPWPDIRDNFKALRYAIRAVDRLTTFYVFGKIFAQILLLRRSYQNEKGVEFSRHAFTNSCRKISDYLKVRMFNDADLKCKELIRSIRLQNLHDEEDLSYLGWQALVGYWIWMRLGILKKMIPGERNPFWLGPSKILANQIDAILYFYSHDDKSSMVDLMISSFDWRLRIPKFIYMNTRTARH